mgnify:FL=1
MVSFPEHSLDQFPLAPLHSLLAIKPKQITSKVKALFNLSLSSFELLVHLTAA